MDKFIIYKAFKSENIIILTVIISLLFWGTLITPLRFRIALILVVFQFYNIANFKLLYSDLYIVDRVALWLIVLTIIISALSWAAAIFFIPRFTNHRILLVMITFVLILVFSTKSIITFYFWFEVSLIPIFLIILGWGYQPERIFAGQRIFLYTIIGSIPLFLLMVWLQQAFHIFSFQDLYRRFGYREKTWLREFFLLISFLIKFPIFITHLWLPKAHVEAPVRGSIILAGTLLKLGGFGLIRLSPLITSIRALVIILALFSLFGGAWVSLLCVTQTDLKILIAYSSVRHISLAIAALLIKTKLAVLGGFCMLLAHGWTSAAIFMAANIFYLRAYSRNVNFVKGLLTFLPILSLAWAAICVRNIAGPPSFNLFTEVVLFLRLISAFKRMALPLAIMAFFAAAYSLALVAIPQQGKVPIGRKILTISNLLEVGSLLGFVLLSYRIAIFIFPAI